MGKRTSRRTFLETLGLASAATVPAALAPGTPGQREVDAVVAGDEAGLTIDPDQSNLWLSSDILNSGNLVHYSNGTVDQLRQARGWDPTARKPLYEQFRQLLADDQPSPFLYSANAVAVINRRLQYVTPQPLGGF